MAERLLSIGIDIGTSTTQMILSIITFENMASSFTVPRVVITDKEVIYKSDIIITPIDAQNRIDSLKIQEFIVREYKKADIHKEDIQTGAVIITGESARKENAKNVADALSGFVGDFVVATAGPDLESIIAGKGSGAYSYSLEHHNLVANLDIGGGTTNIVVFRDGDILDTGCFDIGGRQVKVDEEGKVSYIAPKVKKIIDSEGLSLKEGDAPNLNEIYAVIDIFIQVLSNAIGQGRKSKYYDLLITNKGLSLDHYDKITHISFSGGVADCIKNNLSPYQYGDIGPIFGKRLKASSLYQDNDVIKTAETIRATVVGAGSHTMDISGSTIAYDKDAIPLKNLPVVSFSTAETSDQEKLPALIKEKILWHNSDDPQNCALSFVGYQNPTYQNIMNLGDAIYEGSQFLREEGFPIVVVVENDMAKSLGHYLKAKLKEENYLICIDRVIAGNGDYIDIGEPIANGEVLPVVVKTLVFS